MKSTNCTIGILAHVDAGKTTLSESILYLTGLIKKQGRVDHKNAYLDTFELEKNRGITIFSKQAVFPLGGLTITLLDTPGHVDFSAEMERTLRVLDYAVLVINATDGVQGHTLTVWKLLERYHVPTFIFVNKMDLQGTDQTQLMVELQRRVHDHCLHFSHQDPSKHWDELALCNEQLMEVYLENGQLTTGDIQEAIAHRHVFPVYFGSALKNQGVIEFLNGLSLYLKSKAYPDVFGARVFKVARNDQGERLTYVKVTGGTLKVKEVLSSYDRSEEVRDGEGLRWQEKVDQIRIYSGATYESVKEVGVGSICALTGLTMTRPGDGLGFEQSGEEPILTPVLSYKVSFPQETNIYEMLKNLQMLEEEEPHLNVLWKESISEIHLQVMGEIQIEILKSTILSRFGVEAMFDKGNLVYRETIQGPVIGKGHFEPLKHYAEVHLLIEPLPQGSGMVYQSSCSEDVMDRNWQRLALSHLEEQSHLGVLTGSMMTDLKVTLIAGKGHNKHTEGGDFREATFRALRQGLMKAESLLLEPVYAYVLEVPKEVLGKAISDIERLNGRYEDPIIDDQLAYLKGVAPVATMMHYMTEVMAYTKGLGRLTLTHKGYEPCHNQEEVIVRLGYKPEEDKDHPAGSIFCKKGSGFVVPFYEADRHMHVDSGVVLQEPKEDVLKTKEMKGVVARNIDVKDAELEAIFTRTYGEKKERTRQLGSRLLDGKSKQGIPKVHETKALLDKKDEPDQAYLLVDGYNIIFAWEELKTLAKDHLESARTRLMDMLCNYQGQKGDHIILVFDAYRVAGNRGSSYPYHNIHVVFTKEAETADRYIERLVHQMRPNYEITVATSDVVEQIIILGKGARRLSAEGLRAELDHYNQSSMDHYKATSNQTKHRPFDQLLEQPTRHQ